MSDVLPVLTGPVPSEIDAKAIAAEAIEAAFKLIHDRFAEAGFPASGDVMPHEAYVLDAVGEAFVGMVAANVRDLPQEGDRVRLVREVWRYPHAKLAAGMTGELTEVSAELVAMKLDEDVEGLEAWENELHWYPQDDDADWRADIEVVKGEA